MECAEVLLWPSCGHNQELDSEEEAELERQKEVRKAEIAAWKLLSPEEQAAATEAKKALAKEQVRTCVPHRVF